ncbi:hypothetical protein [Brevibacillus laterosporus]
MGDKFWLGVIGGCTVAFIAGVAFSAPSWAVFLAYVLGTISFKQD